MLNCLSLNNYYYWISLEIGFFPLIYWNVVLLKVREWFGLFSISEFIGNQQPFLINRYKCFIGAWNMDNFSLNKFNWVAIIRNTKKMSSNIFVRWMYQDHTTPYNTIPSHSFQLKEQIKSKLIVERGRYNLWGKSPIYLQNHGAFHID